MDRTQVGDLVQLTGKDHKYRLVRLAAGAQMQTHRGVIQHDDMIGKPWGSLVTSHLGRPFYLMPPSLSDVLRDLRRRSQIVFPKDIGYILLKLSICPGLTVVEAGTGSGAMTVALASAVGPAGHVISYDVRADMQAVARDNLKELGLGERVSLKLKDIGLGFDEQGVPSLFLDLPNPYDYMPQVRAALAPGGFFGAIVPTTNQVSLLLSSLERNQYAFVEVCEISLRYFKPFADRLRPTDRMVAHTGFLIFARPVAWVENPAATEATPREDDSIPGVEEALPDQDG